MSEHSPEKRLSPVDLFIVVVLLLGISGGIYGIYRQLKTMEQIGEQRPTDLVKTPNAPQPPPKPVVAPKPKNTGLSVAKLSRKSLEKGAQWLADRFVALNEKQGGWPHFQWEISLVFSLPVSFQAELAQGTISEKLKKQFVAHQMPLSSKASIEEKTKGAKWHLQATPLSFSIQLEKEEGKNVLHVYQEKKPGAPTTALALFAMTSLPKDLREKHNKVLYQASNFLLSKMDEKGAISEKMAHIQYRNYTTAMTLMALFQLDSKKFATEIDKIQQYLLASQLTELPRWNWHYGTWNYYETPHLGLRVDISVTAYVLESLRKTGIPTSNQVFQKAMVFLRKTQNYRKNRSKLYDGGFAFHPRNSKAGETPMEDGETLYASYGSATCDGLRSLMYCGLSVDAPRVRGAKYWLAMHFRVDRNPGFGSMDPAGIGRGIRYYYYHSLAKALLESQLDKKEPSYLTRLSLYVITRLQRKDGSWQNDTNTMSEDYPIIATSFALLTLSTLEGPLTKLEKPAKPKNAEKQAKKEKESGK